MNNIVIKRVFDAPNEKDSKRVLVDRLWPRGISKEDAQLAVWMKEIAPSHILRAWFGHAPERFEVFKEKYILELASDHMQPYIQQLITWSELGQITLLYAAKDIEHNNAVVLKEYLEKWG